jgi:hypothetical protein
MSYLLLTDAGFSRNWGGWLVDECFEYLLSCSEITPVIRRAACWHSMRGSSISSPASKTSRPGR